MTDLWRDIRQAFRGLMRSPGLTVVAVLSLALGIGLNSTVFAILNTVLEPPSRMQPRGWVNINVSGRGLTYPEYLALRGHSRTLAHLVVADFTGLSATRGGQAQFVPAAEVSPDFFAAMGVRPFLGRAFGENEPNTVVLGYGYWKQQFGGDPGVLGQKLPAAGRALTIVGVAPPELRRFKAMRIDAIVPFEAPSSPSKQVGVLARLNDGVSPAQAEAEVLSLLQSSRGSGAERLRVSVSSSFSEALPVEAGALLIQCIVGLVLLIACANVASLLLARNERRATEIALRLALGARNWHLVRRLLAESVALGLLAAPVGLLLAVWSIGAVESIRIPSPVPIQFDFRPDARMLGFVVVISILAGMVAGFLPARTALRSGFASSLRGGAQGRGFRRFGFGSVLVAAQVAVSMLWLTAAGILCRSLVNLRDADPGFKTERRLAAVIVPFFNGYTPARTASFRRSLRPRLEALPGIVSVGIAQQAPLGLIGGFSLEVYPAGTGTASMALSAGANAIEPGYFQTLGIPLLNGRDFRVQDPDDAKMVIVNETLARRFWPGENPTGKTLTVAGATQYRVIGVARDSKYYALTEPPKPFLYVPFRSIGPIAVLLQCKGDPAAVQEAVRNTIAAVDPNLPLISLTSMQEAVALSSDYWPRLATGSALMAALLAIALTSLGLYGTVSNFVSRRTREIGICMALGATPADVFAGVFRQGWRAVAVGCAAGLPFALAVSMALRAFVYRVPVADPYVFVPVCLFLFLVACAAMYLPARRATKVSPSVALRQG